MKASKSLLVLAAMLSSVILWPPDADSADSKKRAEELLQKKVADRKGKGATPAKAAPPAVRLATPAELEQLYLNGRITAKEYQRQVAEYKATASAQTNPPARPQAVDVLRQEMAKPRPAPPAGQKNVEADPETKILTEFESKFDELLRQKAEREKATQTNATPNLQAFPPELKAKREKLDWLLRLYIDGKLSEQDYNDRRAKLIAEPE